MYLKYPHFRSCYYERVNPSDHRSYSIFQSITCWHNDLQSPSDFTNGLTSMVFSSLRTQSAEALSTLRPQLRKRKHCDGFDRSSASKYLGKRKEGCVEAVIHS